MDTIYISIVAVLGALAFIGAMTKAGNAERRNDMRSAWTWGGVAAFTVFVVVVLI